MLLGCDLALFGCYCFDLNFAFGLTYCCSIFVFVLLWVDLLYVFCSVLYIAIYVIWVISVMLCLDSTLIFFSSYRICWDLIWVKLPVARFWLFFGIWLWVVCFCDAWFVFVKCGCGFDRIPIFGFVGLIWNCYWPRCSFPCLICCPLHWHRLWLNSAPVKGLTGCKP